MIRINLLPNQERKTGSPINHALILFGVMALFCIALGYGYGLYTDYRLNQELANKEAQCLALAEVEQNMQAAAQRQDILNKKNIIISTLNKERKSWPAIIASLTNITPKQVWFEDISLADSTTLKLTGNAVSYPELVKFLKVLEDGNILGEPMLTSSQIDNSNNKVNSQKFEISIKLKGL